MFDKFLKVAHQAPTASHRVSTEQDLFDFLSSEPKVACFTGHDDHKWLEQFAGTPMQEQAMALEQQDIQNEIAEKQYNMQNSGKQQSFWQNRDQIQLQKRMLELQLYQAKTGPSVAAAASGAPAPTGPEADAATVGAGGGSPATPETGMMETGAKVAFTLSDAAIGPGVGAMIGAPIGAALADEGQVGRGIAQGAGYGMAAGSLALPAMMYATHAGSMGRGPALAQAAHFMAHPFVAAPLIAGLGVGGGISAANHIERKATDAARQAGEEELAKSAAVEKFLWADQMGRMMETGAKVAKANPDGTYAEDFLYGGVPGAVGGLVTGAGVGDVFHPVVIGGSAGLGGALSMRGGRAADQVGVSHTEGAKRSAIGQMIGGGLGAVGAGLATGGHPVAVPAGGVLGALSGHALAMQKYRNMARQQATENEEPDAAKLSAAEEQFLWADRMGRMMAKQALDMTALKGLGNTALDWAKKNPTKALSAAGGVGGAAYGAATAKGQNGQGPTIGQRLGRAAGFGALGAGAGAAAGAGVHGVQAVRGRMAATGETARQATGGLLAEKATGAYDKLHSAAVNADAQQRAAVAANPNAATSMVEGLSPHLENFRNRVGSWAHGV